MLWTQGRERQSTEMQALLLIDIQEGFKDPKWGKRNNQDAESNIAALLGAWRAAKRPVIHVQHVSLEPQSVFKPGSPGVEIQPFARPVSNELLVQKQVNSAFIGTRLDAILKQRGVTSLVIVGLTTDHCVSTTARMAGNLGYRTIVVSDAAATFERKAPDQTIVDAETIHRINLASLDQEFAEVIDSKTVLTLAE